MRISYRTDNVPSRGMGAFMPVPMTTPLASTGGTQKRYLDQWTEAEDPNLAGMAAAPSYALSYQPSYAQVGASPDFAGHEEYTGVMGAPRANTGVPDRTYVPGLPGAFRPVVNARHHMAYIATAQNMGPWAWQKMAGFNTQNNPLPVPAANPGRTPLPAMRQPPYGTVVATAWPRPFITWPTWGTSRQA